MQRATSTHEGIAIAHAISEHLLQRSVPTILTTHFTSLASTLSPYPNFASHHLLVSVALQPGDGSHALNHLHRIATGVCEEEHYGLILARDCHLPADILQDADRMARSLHQRGRLAENASNGAKAANRRALITQLCDELRRIEASNIVCAVTLRHKLASLQAAFVKTIEDNLPVAVTDSEGEPPP